MSCPCNRPQRTTPGQPPRSLAARFAAKEALAKALGAGGGMLWTDAEIRTDDAGRPSVDVHGTVAERAAACGVRPLPSSKPMLAEPSMTSSKASAGTTETRTPRATA